MLSGAPVLGNVDGHESDAALFGQPDLLTASRLRPTEMHLRLAPMAWERPRPAEGAVRQPHPGLVATIVQNGEVAAGPAGACRWRARRRLWCRRAE